MECNYYIRRWNKVTIFKEIGDVNSRKKIYLSSPHMSSEGFELQYVHEAFMTNWISPQGANVDSFEMEFSKEINIKKAVALSSGTAAMHMALKACNIKKGDIVFCPTFTFAATANPILYEQGIPVFIDSDQESWNLDPNALEAAFKKYPNVKAVIVVHLYGLAAKMDEILYLCEKYGVPLIEDSAESLGTTYKCKNTGTFGDIGVFSFNGNKIITTSSGGMLVSNNDQIIEKVRFWSTQSKEKERFYHHKEVGYNYRMSNVLAGIGRGQLKVLKQRIKKKKYIFEFYKEQLKDTAVEFMPINDWNKPNYWLSCITLKGNKKPIDMIQALEEKKIESRHLWKPMHMQPLFKDYDYIGSNVSEELFKTGVCLPSDTKMTDEDLMAVTNIIKNLLQ